ncbi:Alpha/Beta hydrolase protein [Gongronella butleri]|nr:Alpha/Beta hydrolase protein [Gongronella butleri]
MVVKRVVRASVAVVLVYLAFMVALCFPTPQKMMVYLHWLQLPLQPKFTSPEYYGFAHNAVRNVQITTKDEVTLGAWHILPSEFHSQAGLRARDHVDGDADAILADAKYDALIYFHGNALHRAAPWRIDLYKMLRLKFPRINILTIDYRGFGDSNGSPSEDGLALDARAAFDWLLARNVPADRIALIGHSLGTGVATRLAQELSVDGLAPKALILQAPYSSITNLVFEYRLLETFPLFAPLQGLRGLQDWMLSKLVHRFDSLSRISSAACPILIAHGAKDKEIPIQHAYDLFHMASAQAMPVDPSSVIIDEASVWHGRTRQEKPIILARLESANHNNLGYFDYLYEAMAEITDW